MNEYGQLILQIIGGIVVAIVTPAVVLICSDILFRTVSIEFNLANYLKTFLFLVIFSLLNLGNDGGRSR